MSLNRSWRGAIAVGLAISLACPGLANGPSSLRQTSVGSDAAVITDWNDGVVEVTGRGVARGGGNSVQDQLMAAEAARAVAFARLAEALHAVRVEGTATVGGGIKDGQVVETRVSGLVRGARETEHKVWRQEDTAGGKPGFVAEVTLRACLTAVTDACRNAPTLVAVLTPEIPPPAPAPRPTVEAARPIIPPVAVSPPKKVSLPSPTESGNSVNPHTGLVVVVGKLPFLPVLRPEIVTADGRAVFSGAKVRKAVAANEGAAQYSGSIEDARKRPQAGTNPLVLDAVRLTDDNRIVVSDADASRIAVADRGANGFLTEGKVVIVVQ